MLLVIVAGVFALLSLQDRSGHHIIRIGSAVFRTRVATTQGERENGLSHRLFMPPGSAMLFVFEHAEKHCFWMKDMKFKIDIIWFDENKRLVYQEQNVAPASYPKNFCPPTPVKYVVEVNAGMSLRYGWQIGDKLTLQNQ